MDVCEDEYQGLRRITLQNTFLTLVTLPQLGGKIISLKSNISAREWLHLNPNFQLKPANYGDSYVHDNDSGGWDECFPSVSEETHPDLGVHIPDHGELWGLPWDHEIDRGDSAITLRMRLQSEHLNCVFHRDISINKTESGVIFSYRLFNSGTLPMKYIWSAHPIFQIEAGMRISLPENSPIRVNGEEKRVSGSWPLHQNHGDVSLVPNPTVAVARKLFVGPLEQGSVTLISVTGESLRIEFDSAEVPYVGLWQNFGGWSGNEEFPPYFNMGVEPCSGMPDSLRNAVKWNSYKTVLPQEEVHWQLRVTMIN